MCQLKYSQLIGVDRVVMQRLNWRLVIPIIVKREPTAPITYNGILFDYNLRVEVWELAIFKFFLAK